MQNSNYNIIGQELKMIPQRPKQSGFSTLLSLFDGLNILPFGNGAERTLENKDIGAGIYKTCDQAFKALKCTKVIEPDSELSKSYWQAYANWVGVLEMRVDRLGK